MMRRFAIAVLSLSAACGGSSSSEPSPPAPTPASLSAWSTIDFQTIANETVSPQAKVTDAGGKPIAGISVSFAAAGGTVSATSAVSGADGIATVRWTQPATAGATTLTASIPGTQMTAKFTAGVTTSLVGRWVGTTTTGTTYTVVVTNHTVNGTGTVLMSCIGFVSSPSSPTVSNIGVIGNANRGSVQFTFGPAGSVQLTFLGTVTNNDKTLTGNLTSLAAPTPVPFTMTYAGPA